MPSLKIYKTHPDIQLPKFFTTQSACFDIAFQGHGKHEYHGYNQTNKQINRPTPNGRILINAGERVMIPTGLIMDIPVGYSVRIHARSGMSLRHGLILANGEAVIDSDYVNEVYILMYNRTHVGAWLSSGDRIAQAELVKQVNYDIIETLNPPTIKTNRNGGMGSTGVK